MINMEEKNVKTEQTENKKEGLIALGGIFIIGYLFGVAACSKSVNQAYSRGVSDTLEKIIFRLER